LITKYRDSVLRTGTLPPMKSLRVLAALSLFAVFSGCLGGDTVSGPQLDGEGRRVLFIGNSYLYFEDIPGIVQALADSAGGDKLAVETIAAPDFALIDHWNTVTARAEIAKGGWEWVVLQQGPSSVEVNRDTLRLATKLFAAEIAKVNAKPALFSAWPSQPRRQDFDRAIESYALAAADVDGILLPVAAAWLAAWEREPAIELYADGLHASPEGAYLSALVIYARLLGKSPVGLPPRLRLRSGEIIAIDAQRAALLQSAAAEATTN
jgi:hypothetical protein